MRKRKSSASLSSLPKRGREFVAREMARPMAAEDLTTCLRRIWDDNIKLAEKCRDKHDDTFRMPYRVFFARLARAVPEEHALTAFALAWTPTNVEFVPTRIARRWTLNEPAELGQAMFVMGRLELAAAALVRRPYRMDHRSRCVADFDSVEKLMRLSRLSFRKIAFTTNSTEPFGPPTWHCATATWRRSLDCVSRRECRTARPRTITMSSTGTEASPKVMPRKWRAVFRMP